MDFKLPSFFYRHLNSLIFYPHPLSTLTGGLPVRAIAFMLVLSLALLSTMASAEVPGLIGYQGTLADAYGVALDTTVAMTFSIYTDSLGGTQVWTETQSAVEVGNGLFNVLLGRVNAIEDTVFNGPNRWLGVQVGGDAELAPRQRMASVAYAMRAGGGSSDTYWSASGSDIYYSAGDVGIGTSTPGQPLDVLGDVLVGGDSTAHDGGGEVVVFRGESGDWRVGVQNELTEEESDFFIGLTSSEDGTFHIERGGNVGIGTTEPEAKLDVRNLPLVGRANAVYGKGGSVLDPTEGYLGNLEQGVYGEHLESGNYGYLGGGVRGAYGRYGTDGNYGYLGGNTLGAYGQHASTGNWGALGSSSVGVRGSGSTYGVKGESADGTGVYGEHTSSGNYGSLGGTNQGVLGQHETTGNYGQLGSDIAGVYGYGNTDPAISAISANAPAIYCQSLNGTGLVACGTDFAADFLGNVIIREYASGDTIVELGEGLDYAEGFDIREEAAVQSGMVVVIDPDNPGQLTVSRKPYDTRVAGIVAGGRGLGSGVRLGVGQFAHDVALAGRVYCNVDATETGIEPGDLLTTSAVPGYAMKATDALKSQGAILGKAMERLERGRTGQILVLVTLQ